MKILHFFFYAFFPFFQTRSILPCEIRGIFFVLFFCKMSPYLHIIMNDVPEFFAENTKHI